MIISELLRKTIHLSASILLFPIMLFDQTTNILIYTILFCIMILFEITRVVKCFPGDLIYNKILKQIMRTREMPKYFYIKSADQMILGILLLSVFFERSIIIPSFLVLCISDTMAAIIGIKYGKIKVYNGKSIEGFLAFFISCIIVLLCFTNINILNLIFISFIIAIIEMFDFYRKIHLDDNIVIPISVAVLLTL